MNDKFNSLSDERQKMIINGAMKCFSIHGYEKASMADIAKEAGATYHVKSMVLVNTEILDEYLENFKDQQ